MELVDQDVPGPRRDFVGYGRRQPKVVWPNGAKVAVNLVVNYEEGSEYSKPAGDGRNEGLAEIPYAMDAEYRDLCAESVYEYGSRAGIWRLMRLFDEYDVKVTFFACAVALERNPEVGQWLREAGHEPCSHGWRWSEHWLFDREQEREHMQWAIESIERTCGERPLGWYCRYGPSVNTRELVVEEGGFVYDADAYNDDLPYFTEVKGNAPPRRPLHAHLQRRPLHPPAGILRPDRLLRHTAAAASTSTCREGEAGHPKMMSIGLHPRWAGQAGRASAPARVHRVRARPGDVWFARRLDIARWWLEHHEEWM